MTNFNKDKLSNDINVITRRNTNTPRTSINIYMKTGSKYDELAGTANLSGRLLLQGTETKNAETIANFLDSNGIELSIEAKQDYLRARALFLNEDFDEVLDILEDLLKYSTFSDVEKEARKLEGELKLDLDSPKTQAFNNLVKNIYPNHPYGYGHTKVLEDLNKINTNEIKDYYFKKSFIPENMLISAVGDFNEKQLLKALEAKFGKMEKASGEKFEKNIDEIPENKTVTIAKEDSAQAQIIQGWLAPSIIHEDYPAFVLMNNILGASGLSSRLFVELRDKKGLAYTVRSTYEPLLESGLFSIYIGTAPNNIKVSLEGFDVEIKKLQTELVSEEELAGAKNNYLGKRAFFHETNSQQAYYLGFFESMGLGADFDNEIVDIIKKVTPQQIQDAANKYLSKNSVISILAPEKNLKY